jgi:voltage-dependent calcium channel L type alpha-1D
MLFYKYNIIGSILISSILLAFDNPLDNPDSEMKIALKIIDLIFTIQFSIELIMKVISMGFVYNWENNKNSYLRNSWNILDFLVVTTSVLD